MPDRPLIPGTTERRIATNGVELHTVIAGDGPPVVLAHGFPELAYSWRHQIPALADAGYTVIAPDQRGYGRSSVPAAVTDYDIEHLSGDLLGVLDALGHERAAFVGHDWGALLVWPMSLLHPERFAGVCALSVPYTKRTRKPPVERMREVFAEVFFYIVYFQEIGPADAELAADPAETMRRMLGGLALAPDDGSDRRADDGRGFVERMAAVPDLPDWISEDEVAVYADAFARTGFTGPLNWYRNMDRNWHLTPQLADAHVTVPSALIAGSADPVLVTAPISKMDGYVDDHRGTTLIDGAGHWVQQERPDEVNAALLDFLGTLDW